MRVVFAIAPLLILLTSTTAPSVLDTVTPDKLISPVLSVRESPAWFPSVVIWLPSWAEIVAVPWIFVARIALLAGFSIVIVLSLISKFPLTVSKEIPWVAEFMLVRVLEVIATSLTDVTLKLGTPFPAIALLVNDIKPPVFSSNTPAWRELLIILSRTSPFWIPLATIPGLVTPVIVNPDNTVLFPNVTVSVTWGKTPASDNGSCTRSNSTVSSCWMGPVDKTCTWSGIVKAGIPGFVPVCT